MSNPDTWMPLYISRYLGDTGHLTVAEHGAYLLLLMQYWVRGPLPDDDQDLAIMAKTDIKLWRKGVGQKIRKFFVLRADGLLHQKRIDAELAKAAEIIQKKRAAANTRWSSDEPPPKPPPNGRDADHSAHAEAMHVHSTSTASGEHVEMHVQCPLPIPLPEPGEETEGSNQESVYNHLPESPVSAPGRAREAPAAAETDFSEDADVPSLDEIMRRRREFAEAPSPLAEGIASLASSLRMTAYPPREALRTRNDQVDVVGTVRRPQAFHLTREQINQQLRMTRRRQ